MAGQKCHPHSHGSQPKTHESWWINTPAPSPLGWNNPMVFHAGSHSPPAELSRSHTVGTSMISRIMHPLLTACIVSKSQINKLAFESMSTKTEGKRNTFGVIRSAVVMEIHPKLASEHIAEDSMDVRSRDTWAPYLAQIYTSCVT